MTLLEQAKQHTKKVRAIVGISDEGIELALAWARKEVTLTAVQQAIGAHHGGTSTYGFLARSLAEHVRRKG